MENSTEMVTASTMPSFMQAVEAAPEPPVAVEGIPDYSNRTEEEAERLSTLSRVRDRLENISKHLATTNEAVRKTVPEFVALHSLGEVLDQVILLEASVDSLEEQFKGTKAQISVIREVHFPERLDSEDTKTTTSSATGNRVTRTARLMASIRSDKTGEIQTAAYQWLRDNDLAPLIKETVSASSLSAAAKELVENGQDLPDELFNVYTKAGVSITRGKK